MSGAFIEYASDPKIAPLRRGIGVQNLDADQGSMFDAD